jgi:phosphohistidine phosphatase
MATERDDMDLLLWRHAEAEEGFPDTTRALTKKGHKQAEAIARWLAARLPKRARVLVSPATRAQQTAAPLDLPITTANEVDVGAAASSVLQVAGWPDGNGTVLVVGHQPTLGRVAALVLTGEEAEWPMKKGAVWWFTARARDHGKRQVTLRAVIGPDLV